MGARYLGTDLPNQTLQGGSGWLVVGKLADPTQPLLLIWGVNGAPGSEIWISTGGVNSRLFQDGHVASTFTNVGPPPQYPATFYVVPYDPSHGEYAPVVGITVPNVPGMYMSPGNPYPLSFLLANYRSLIGLPQVMTGSSVPVVTGATAVVSNSGSSTIPVVTGATASNQPDGTAATLTTTVTPVTTTTHTTNTTVPTTTSDPTPSGVPIVLNASAMANAKGWMIAVVPQLPHFNLIWQATGSPSDDIYIQVGSGAIQGPYTMGSNGGQQSADWLLSTQTVKFFLVPMDLAGNQYAPAEVLIMNGAPGIYASASAPDAQITAQQQANPGLQVFRAYSPADAANAATTSTSFSIGDWISNNPTMALVGGGLAVLALVSFVKK